MSEGEHAQARVPRLFTGADGLSYFDEVVIPLDHRGRVGLFSNLLDVRGLIFNWTSGGFSSEPHCAPQRQFAVVLQGCFEISASGGGARRFVAGEIVLLEDVAGAGHTTRAIGSGEGRVLYMPIGDGPPIG